MKKGLYEVSWENHDSTKIHTSEVIVTKQFESKSKLEDFIKQQLVDFYAFRGDYKHIKDLDMPKRQVAIEDFDNEFEINSLIALGYEIREFFEGKCILYLPKDKTFIK